MKRTYNLLDANVEGLARVASLLTGGNVSLVVDTAADRFLALPTQEQRDLIERFRVIRAPLTRAGWMNAFYDELAERLGTRNSQQGEFGPRTYGTVTVLQLLKGNGEVPEEADPFEIHAFEPRGPGDVRYNWTFGRHASPGASAHAVAEWVWRESPASRIS